MRVLTAQLSGGDRNADRVLVTDNAVLVLDGASAFEPVPVGPGEYAETLGQAVARRLVLDPHVELSAAVAAGISATTRVLKLRPGQSPSSTIAILRVRDQVADLFVLGDSPIYYGTTSMTTLLSDNRLAEIGRAYRESYAEALRAGCGYSEKHRRSVAALQRAQRQYRNTAGGYWIAEAEPDAAYHAITATLDPHTSQWAILGTDGATDLIANAGQESWFDIANLGQQQLHALLARLHRWERDVDPNGQRIPRAKRHDDKTLAVVPQVFPA